MRKKPLLQQTPCPQALSILLSFLSFCHCDLLYLPLRRGPRYWGWEPVVLWLYRMWLWKMPLEYLLRWCQVQDLAVVRNSFRTQPGQEGRAEWPQNIPSRWTRDQERQPKSLYTCVYLLWSWCWHFFEHLCNVWSVPAPQCSSISLLSEHLHYIWPQPGMRCGQRGQLLICWLKKRVLIETGPSLVVSHIDFVGSR